MMEDSAPGDVLVPVACSPRRDTFNFIFHPDTSVDLALTAIQALPGIMHDYFPYDSSYVMSSDSLFPGEDVFVVGFPLGMGGERNTPIVRAGTVALTERGSREFLVDVDVFPGNSGGPVWLKPSLFNYRTNVFGEMTRPILVGVLRSYVPYEEVAYSFATGASVPRVVFTENSGLARAVSASLVLGMLNRARTRR